MHKVNANYYGPLVSEEITLRTETYASERPVYFPTIAILTCEAQNSCELNTCGYLENSIYPFIC